MKLVKNPIKIIENTLNYVDPRLMDHGKRVGYLVYRLLKNTGTADREQLRDAALLGLLHDIGAYKTEEVDDMVKFEIDRVWEHSIYGYLFLKYFSPLKRNAEAILFHHADCAETAHLDAYTRKLAGMLHVADRFDVLSQLSGMSAGALRRHLEKRRGAKFDCEVVDVFFEGDWTDYFSDLENDEEFHEILYDRDISEEDVRAFIHMLVLSIDFRSPQTVGHTFMLVGVAEAMARLLGYPRAECERVVLASLLHDLGKVGVSVNILEKPGALTPAEMERMKRHIDMTEDILRDNIDEDVYLMAVRHHEKLNGSGYPRGLSSDQLSPRERLIAVADIFSALCGKRSYKDSFSREKTAGIMANMAADQLIDPHLTALATDRYDDILRDLDVRIAPIFEAHENLSAEYDELLTKSSARVSSW